MATGTTGSFDSFDRTHAMSQLLAQNWWALALRGVFAIVFALIAFFFLREKVKARLWAAIGFVLVGLAVVARVWDSDLDPIGVALALVAGCLAWVAWQAFRTLRGRRSKVGSCCATGCAPPAEPKKSSDRVVFLPVEMLTRRRR